jgi:hypothetical protein
VFPASEKQAESKKVAQTIFDRGLFLKTQFPEKRVLYLVENCFLAKTHKSFFGNKIALGWMEDS